MAKASTKKKPVVDLDQVDKAMEKEVAENDAKRAKKLAANGDPGGMAGYLNLLDFAPKYSVGIDMLHGHYTAWANAEGAQPLNVTDFVAQLLLDDSIERLNSVDGEYLQGVCLSEKAAEYERQLKKKAAEQGPAATPEPTPAPVPAVAGFARSTDVKYIYVEELHTWDGNVRQQKSPEFMAELEANINQNGTLTSLVVRPAKQGGYEVIAGEQRLQANINLIAKGTLPSDTKLPCRVIDCTDAEAREVSLAENVIRQQLNPADEFEAFQKMAEEGASVSDIAHKFGVGESTVKKRLKLANVSPKILQDFREGKVTLNQLQAFAITDDHKAQVALVDDSGGYANLDTDEIHNNLQDGKVAATDKRVKAVGLEELEKSGVKMVRDMFDPDRAYIEDPKALNKAFNDKMKKVHEELSAEGWGFVTKVSGDVHSWTFSQKYSDVAYTKAKLSKADEITLKDLQAQLKKLEDSDDWSDEASEKEERLEKQIKDIEEGRKQWTDKAKKSAGVIYSVDASGIQIRRGVKPKPQAKEKSTTSEPAKPKEKSEAEKRHLTEAVLDQLTVHRNFAIASRIAQDKDVGFKCAAAMMIAAYFHAHDYYDNGSVFTNDGDFRVDGQELPYEFPQKEKVNGHIWMQDREKELRKNLPKKGCDVLAWCFERKVETLAPYLAFIAAAAYCDTSSDGKATKQTELLKETLKVDYADFYAPTQKNLFGKLGQEQLRELLKEIKGSPITPAELKLGKDGLAQVCELEATKAFKAGKPWLPYPLSDAGKKPAAKPAAKKSKK